MTNLQENVKLKVLNYCSGSFSTQLRVLYRRNDELFSDFNRRNFKTKKKGVDTDFFKFLFLDTTDKTCEKHVC